MEIFDQLATPMSSSSRRFTEKHGPYTAFIHTYVHQMILELEHRGLIARVPRQPRTIKILHPAQDVPQLQPIKTSVARR